MPDATSDAAAESVANYPVILLIEQPFTEADAAQVRSLHEEIPDRVVYHVLMPVEDAASRIEAGMSALGTGEVMASPAMVLADSNLDDIRREVLDECRSGVADTVARLEAAGATAVGEPVTADPIETLVARSAELDAREVIILTRPHVVAEFFRLDWSSRARRKLGVPVLHLLEHENFDEQAGEGEGITGF